MEVERNKKKEIDYMNKEKTVLLFLFSKGGGSKSGTCSEMLEENRSLAGKIIVIK